MSTKNIWRARMLETRSQLGPDKISQFNRDLCKNLSFIWTLGGGLNSSGVTSLPMSNKPLRGHDGTGRPLWAGYKSFRWEADPSEAITDSMKYLQWAYPRILAATLPERTMEFLKPADSDALWTKNSYGIWEPQPQTSQSINLNDCVGVLVPGVAFDRQGHRLGYGKGYYDSSLKDFKGLKVGVSFAIQLSEETIPFEDSDVSMDIIVTDKEILHVKEVVKH